MLDLSFLQGYGFQSAYSGDAKEYVCEKLEPASSYKFRVSCSPVGI